MTFSMMTLNLHTYQQHPRPCPLETMHLHEREVQIVSEAIAGQGVDVICLQEVGEWVGDPVTYPYGQVPSNMASRIRRRLDEWGLRYHIHQDWSHIGFGRFREGTAILSRHRIMHPYSAYVSYDQRKDWYMSRNITVACVDIPGFGLLHVSNAHLSWAHHGFFDEFNRLRGLIESRRHFGWRAEIIAGDFNAPAGSHAYNHVVHTGEYVDQFCQAHPHRFHEPTYRGEIHGWGGHPPCRIDYIFKRSFSPIGVQGITPIFDERFYPTVSDHFGLLARFEG